MSTVHSLHNISSNCFSNTHCSYFAFSVLCLSSQPQRLISFTMAEQRNIIVLGASFAGLPTTHYIMKHIVPVLKKSKTDAKYHVYLINPSSDWWFRVASPRVAASTTRMKAEQILFDVREGLKQYSQNDLTFIEGTATGVSEQNCEITYQRSQASTEETLSYHALIIATGSRTYHQAFSMSGDTQSTLSSIKSTNSKILTAKDIIISGGGPTSVEFAGEVAEHLNGKPSWFSKPTQNANITLITSSSKLLPTLRPAIASGAEAKLRALGVSVLYNERVVDSQETEGRTTVTLSKGNKLETDLYIPAHGVLPNSSFLPAHLLDEKNYLLTNPQTLRVDAAGQRVYSIGDVASYSHNSVLDVMNALPVLFTNLKRDLLSYNPMLPDEKPRGKDRLYVRSEKEMQLVPIGSGGGVGAIMGWRVPSWFVWMIKGRDFLVGMSGGPTARGESVKKEVVWSREEAAI